MSKVYMIVTNDEYETPVKCDIIGAKDVADYMGISLSYLRQMLCGAKPWAKKYKVIVIDQAKLHEKNRMYYNKRYYMTHDRTEYYKQYYKNNKERINKRMLEYNKKKKMMND